MNYPKFLNNKRETFTFKFDTGIEKEGKFGPQWSFGVKWKHEDGTEEETYLYATEALNRLLERLNPLKNRTIQIELAQDPKDLKRKYWVIYDENGAEITPKGVEQSPEPVQPENPVERKNDAIQATCNCTEKWNNIRIWAESVQKQLTELKRMETLLVELKGESAAKLHASIKSPTIEEPKAPSIEEAAKIVDGYQSDPEIPLINVPIDLDK